MTEGIKGRMGEKRARPFIATVEMRPVPIRGRIDETSATMFINRLLNLEKRSRTKPVLLEINSPGGFVAESMSIIRILDIISCPALTFSHGTVAGPAAIIAAHGLRGYRVASPKCRFLLSPQNVQMRSNAGNAEDRQFYEQLALIFANDTGKDLAGVFTWMEKGLELTAEQALAYGLIDKISSKPLFPPG